MAHFQKNADKFFLKNWKLNCRIFFSFGRFVSWDVLSLGHFVLGTFCPWDLMSEDVLSWDVLSLGTFCLGTFCLCTTGLFTATVVHGYHWVIYSYSSGYHWLIYSYSSGYHWLIYSYNVTRMKE